MLDFYPLTRVKAPTKVEWNADTANLSNEFAQNNKNTFIKFDLATIDSTNINWLNEAVFF